MTNHRERNKQYIGELLDFLKGNRDKLYVTECSYCGKKANQFQFFDERNFIPIQGKKYNNEQAFAIYGDCCLNDARKVERIKRAFIIDSHNNPTYIPVRYLENQDEPEDFILDENDVKEADKIFQEEIAEKGIEEEATDFEDFKGEYLKGKEEEDKGIDLLGILKGKKKE